MRKVLRYQGATRLERSQIPYVNGRVGYIGLGPLPQPAEFLVFIELNSEQRVLEQTPVVQVAIANMPGCKP